MNSRERVEAALRFEEPDRVPIDLAGMRSTSIHVSALAELRRALGLEARRIYLYDPRPSAGDRGSVTGLAIGRRPWWVGDGANGGHT